jgi:hypothetical protein
MAITGIYGLGNANWSSDSADRLAGVAAPASVLTGTIGFTNLSTLYAWTSGTLSTTTLTADDKLRVTVTVAGAAGNQAQGLVLEIVLTAIDPATS